jgi:hypothetical protein
MSVQVFDGDGQPWQNPGRPLTTGTNVSVISIEGVDVPAVAVHLAVAHNNDPNSRVPWINITINARIGEPSRLDLSVSPLLAVLNNKHEQACKPTLNGTRDYKFTLITPSHKFLGAMVTKVDFLSDVQGDHWVTFILTADKAIDHA